MRRIPSIARFLVVAALATTAVACDRPGTAAAAATATGPRTDLSTRPDILFQVFGERDDPRMIPVAVIQGGRLAPITLDTDGWRTFDSLYTRSPGKVTLYQDGRPAGDARIRQGMWEKDGEPLYTLPSCRLLTPLAAVTLDAKVKAGFTVEFLASTAALAPRPAGTPMAPDVADRAAREVAYGVGEREGLSRAQLDSLDFRVVAVHTGASPEPTLVASFIDQGAASSSESADARHVLVIADRAGDRYASTFTHAVNASATNATYRRYVDHLDLTGDGIDEIVLEGWQAGGDTYLMVLAYRSGTWEEAFRGRGQWCLDEKK